MKVLIISHNPISTYQNMGKTMLALFDFFGSAELCQLYIYPSVPDIKKCNSYFRMTDKDILCSYYKLHITCSEISANNNFHRKFTNEQDEKIYSNRKNQNCSRKLARDLMWKFSRWYNKSLRNWLDNEQPDCIFLAPGDAKFIYDIALRISRVRNIPIVAYVCDDYYFTKNATRPLSKVHQRLLRKKMEETFQNTAQIITICDEMKDIYLEKFGIPATTIMTGTSYPIAESYIPNKDPRSITYMGNISCNRHISLIEVGRALDELNAEYNTDYSLKIYTSTNDSEIVSSFKNVKSIALCKYVSGDEFDRVFHSSALLLHIESFDEESIDRVKHSVSTKIADCLGSGIPLIAYGPACVSSMKHLIRNNCAITITSKNDLRRILHQTFCDDNFRKEIVQNALQVARECHVSKNNSFQLYEVAKNAIEQKHQSAGEYV